MYKIIFYAPIDAVDIVKNALFNAGAGKIGNYSHCCWQVLGEGQFKPLAGSNPKIGKIDTIETVAEYKVEMVCEENLIKNVILALHDNHPYEEPAYQVLKIENF